MIEQSVRWVEERIGNITKNLDRRRIPLNNAERKKKEGLGKYPYVGANNILGYIDDYIFDEKILCIAEDGGSWGYGQTCAFIMNEKCWVNNHAHVVIAKDNLVLEYLKYYLNYTDLSLHINGATRGKLNQSALNNIKIPLPPLAEQQKIAAILDAADSLRQKDQQLIEHYTALSQSLFLEMFGDPVGNPMGWDVLAFEENLSDIVGGKSVGGEDRVINGEEKAVLKISSVTSGYFDSTEYKVVDESVVPDNLLHPQKGDLLFSRANTRELVGATCIVDKEYQNLFLPDKIWRLDLKQDLVSNWYIKFLLSHDGFRENLKKVATGTSGSMLNISKAKLRKLTIPRPPITLQNQFAETIQAIEAQKQQAQASLEKSEALFNSLLQRAFKGELTA